MLLKPTECPLECRDKPVQQIFQIHLARLGSAVVRALTMTAGDPASIPGGTINFSNSLN